MKTIPKRQLLLTTAICLLPMLAGALLYSRLPERVPTHFDWSGTPNGWSGRLFAVCGLPCLMAGLHILVCCAMYADPRRANMSRVLRRFSMWTVPAVSVLACGMIFGMALGYPVHIETVLPLLLGLMFLFLGNYLPKVKQNNSMGIRLPWTLQSPENWNRTHRAAGFIMVLGGGAMVVLSLLHLWSQWLQLLVIGGMVLLPIGYSYFLYRRGV